MNWGGGGGNETSVVVMSAHRKLFYCKTRFFMSESFDSENNWSQSQHSKKLNKSLERLHKETKSYACHMTKILVCDWTRQDERVNWFFLAVFKYETRSIT